MKLSAELIGRLVSLTVALTYVLIVCLRAGSGGGLITGLLLLIPLGLIWFGDDIEIPYQALSDCTRGGYDRTPGFLIRGIGWLLLFAPAPWWLFHR